MPCVQRAVALVLLCAYAALSSFGAGWVLCSEADGRVALEGAAAGCCDTAHAEEAPGSPADQEHDCGDCSDVALDELTRSRHADDEHDAPDLAPALRVVPAIATIAHAASCSPERTRAPPRPPPQRAHLLTVRLLL